MKVKEFKNYLELADISVYEINDNEEEVLLCYVENQRGLKIVDNWDVVKFTGEDLESFSPYKLVVKESRNGDE